MKAWRFGLGHRVLEILTIDDNTREVVRVDSLELREPMTKVEAQKFMDSHHPKKG